MHFGTGPAFQLQILTVEQFSGEECGFVAHHPTLHAPEDMQPRCRGAAKAGSPTGLDAPVAIAEMRRTERIGRRNLRSRNAATLSPGMACRPWCTGSIFPVAERQPGDVPIDGPAAQPGNPIFRLDG